MANTQLVQQVLNKKLYTRLAARSIPLLEEQVIVRCTLCPEAATEELIMERTVSTVSTPLCLGCLTLISWYHDVEQNV